MAKKILVTGAGGFVGQMLSERLLNDGHHVVMADVFEPPVPTGASDKAANATRIKADVYEQATEIVTPDLQAIYVFHGIMSAGAEENFELGYRVNVLGTLKVLEAIRTIVPGVRTIFASTTATYGRPLPDCPSEATVPTPEGSYGTQKVMIEYAINDYNRRGYIDAFTLRFPTISVRPGKPTQAASSWMSGIIREPLQGIESSVPVDDDFEAWLCSPRTLLENLVIALDLPGDRLPSHIRQVMLPGITVTVKEMLQALEEVGGKQARDLVKKAPLTPQIKAVLESWPVRFDTTRARQVGFKQDAPFKSAVEDFAASLKT